ncbi:pre-mRNA-splicing helicase BRR2 [Microdochium nivale]|nr:pre-mRNA-splicing helicase BRR2 [Microdochium nivale]
MDMQVGHVDEVHSPTALSPATDGESPFFNTSRRLFTSVLETSDDLMDCDTAHKDDDIDKEKIQSQGTAKGTRSIQNLSSERDYEKDKDQKQRSLEARSPKREWQKKKERLSGSAHATPVAVPVGMPLETTSASATAQGTNTTAKSQDACAVSGGRRTQTIASRRRAQSPHFRPYLRHLALKLSPLVQVSTGVAHDDFPTTMLAYRLLNEAQLDDLAHFYHQRSVTRWSRMYPRPVSWTGDLTIEGKRRKFGRFIGLQGCESPPPMPDVPSAEEIAEAARLAALAAGKEKSRSASKGRY